MSYPAVEPERGHDNPGRAILRKHLACNHGLGVAPAPGVPLIAVVTLEIGKVRLRQKDTHGFLEEFHTCYDGVLALIMASFPSAGGDVVRCASHESIGLALAP
jgi:hypothetical protein